MNNDEHMATDDAQSRRNEGCQTEEDRNLDSATSPVMTYQEVLAMLPAVISDLKHHQEPLRRAKTNKNIRRDMYRNVILLMNERAIFGVEEPLPSGRHGLFIKGYVRDVWTYLEGAYDLIHDIDFERDHIDVLGRN